MTVRERMTTPVLTTLPEATAAVALKTMYDHGIHRLPVVDSGRKLVGIVTRRNLDGRPGTDKVDLHMTPAPHTTHPDTSLTHAATRMRDLHVGALPVLERGQLVGIITESDIFEAFLELLGARRPGTRVVVPLDVVVRSVPRLLAAVERTGIGVTGVTTLAYGRRVWAILNLETTRPQLVVAALRDAGFVPAEVNVLTTVAAGAQRM